MTNEEWAAVQEALVKGGLRECINGLLANRFQHTCPVVISDENRRIIERAYDDGDGGGVTLVPTSDHPWFSGMYEDSEVMLGLEHNGTLYSITTLSGGGLVAVITGQGLVNNEVGVAFHGVSEAKAYVKGLTAK